MRCGCLTGPNHSGVELHGFLSYLIRCNLEGKTYRVYGYKGKQVRDNIHAHDVTQLIECFIEAPRFGEVYNLGGESSVSLSFQQPVETLESISVLEALRLIKEVSGKEMSYEYVDQNRRGDHICYISNLSKIKAHFPKWKIRKNLKEIFREIYEAWLRRTRLPR